MALAITRLLKVVEIIDEYRVAINAGSSSGIVKGQRFQFYGVGDELQDPDTGESLGVLELLRGNGEVIHVQEKIATVQSTARRTARYRRDQRAMMGIAHLLPEPEYEDMPFQGIRKGDYARAI